MATDSQKAKPSTVADGAKPRVSRHIPAMETALPDDTTPASERSIQKLQRAIVDGLEDVKAQDIRVYNTAHLSPLFERVVIASGTSNRQTKALAASVRDAVREAGFPKPRVEGEDNGEWIVVDCGAAVVHVMQPAIRQYYTLEDIWGDKPVRMRLGAAAAKAGAEKRVSRTAARTAAKKEAQAEAAADAAAVAPAVPAAAKPARKTAAKATAAQAPAKAATPRSLKATATVDRVSAKPARKTAVPEVAAAADAAAPKAAKTAKPRARKADAVTLVVGKTVSKKAIKPKSAQ